MLRGQSTPIAILLVCFVLGLMLAVQFRVQQRQELLAATPEARRADEAGARLKAAEAERDRLRDEVEKLRLSLAAASAGGSDAVQALEAQLRSAQLRAGLVDMHGPGLLVTLDDSKVPRQKNEDPNRFILHDEDVLRVVNELNDAGAEAVSINGQRLIGTSEIRCAGSVISINNTRTAPPVRISAIGDPAVLERALRLRGGVIDTLALWGIQVEIEKKQDLLVPAYKGPSQFQYAQPVQKGAPQ